jgi:hypothetical protein
MISTLTHAIANCSAVLNAALAAGGSNGPKSDKMEVRLGTTRIIENVFVNNLSSINILTILYLMVRVSYNPNQYCPILLVKYVICLSTICLERQ